MLSMEQVKARLEIEAGQAFEAAERLEVYGSEQVWIEHYGRLPRALLAEAFRKHGQWLMTEAKKYLPSQPVSEETAEAEQAKEVVEQPKWAEEVAEQPKEAEEAAEQFKGAEEVKEAEETERLVPPFVPSGRRRRGG